MAPEFDPLLALRTLLARDVRFVIIGGVASRLLGSPTITTDLDVCYERSEQNFENLSLALNDLDATLRGAPPEVTVEIDAHMIRMGDHFTFATKAGPLDCLGTPRGSAGYEELVRNAWDVDLGGFKVHVVALQDLARMKRAARRAKDLVELEILGALAQEIEQEDET